jgi:hypothetical protein
MEGQNHASGIILRTPQDWLLWSDQFKSKAKRAQIWHYIENHASIDSDNEQTTLTDALKIPEKPKISQFKKKTANGGRSAMEANTLADLIPDDLSTWTALKADYMAERKENELLLKRLDSLQDWIRQTVAIEHLRLHCTADKEVDEWYFALEARLATDTLDRKARARKDYDEILAIPRRKRLSNKKEVEEWLARWDSAYHELIEAGYEDPRQASLWFADYTEALSQSCYESWIYSYHSSHISEIRKNTLIPAEVLLDTRFFLNSIKNESQLARGKAARGAFGPTLDEASASDHQMEEGPSRERLPSRGRGRGHRGRGPGQQGFRRSSTRESTPRDDRSLSRASKRRYTGGEEKGGRCEACYGRHPLSTCYYLIEKIRPNWWIADQSISHAIEKRLLADKDLAERIRKANMHHEDN